MSPVSVLRAGVCSPEVPPSNEGIWDDQGGYEEGEQHRGGCGRWLEGFCPSSSVVMECCCIFQHSAQNLHSEFPQELSNKLPRGSLTWGGGVSIPVLPGLEAGSQVRIPGLSSPLCPLHATLLCRDVALPGRCLWMPSAHPTVLALASPAANGAGSRANPWAVDTRVVPCPAPGLGTQWPALGTHMALAMCSHQSHCQEQSTMEGGVLPGDRDPQVVAVGE